MSDLRWRVSATEAGVVTDPAELPAELEWLPGAMPSTAASVLLAAGRPVVGLDERDWWWQSTLPADLPAGSLLVCAGIATHAEIWIGAEPVHRVEGMFAPATLPLGDASGETVTVRVLSLTAALAGKRPRPRWKARLVADQGLRWFRTSLTGRMPGFLDGHPVVGPWRGIHLVRGDRPAVLSPGVSTLVDPDGDGVVTVRALLAGVHRPGPVTVMVGDLRAAGTVSVTTSGTATVSATVPVAAPALWWPHTHGRPALVPVGIEVDGATLPLGETGFRSIATDTDTDAVGGSFALLVNGCRLFARGACWSPLADDGTQRSTAAVEESLAQLAAAGLNMVRIPGTTAWAAPEFLTVCDRLGIMVWQDVPMAALDQPDDSAFEAQVTAEVTTALAAVSMHPSLVLVCGGAEIEQQAAMIGLPLDISAAPLSTRLFPAIVAAAPAQLAYVANSPTGGSPAFRVDAGVAQYFGVGAYRRPLEDVRRAGVRFAAECFAFAVPPSPGLAASLTPAQWARSVPRDRGAEWDFADVTDHYAREFFGAEVCAAADPAFLRDLHSAAAAECLTALFAEWRRPGSSCAGALVSSLRDAVPGAGWGLLDASGAPKATWYAARRSAAPLALSHTDEGLNGLALHVVNDRPDAFDGTLRVDLYAGLRIVESGEVVVAVPARDALTLGDADILGVFRDVTRAYRFGPPGFDLVAGRLLDAGGIEVGRTVFLPAGRGLPAATDPGLTVELQQRGGGWFAEVRSQRHARGVVVSVDHGAVDDAWFDLLPGEARRLAITVASAAPAEVSVRALNSDHAGIEGVRGSLAALAAGQQAPQ